jgi:acyl transferase domain-containing protein/NADPH:quinone reductase-like Zn-dependent oxidoreductase/NAD(P)-dependent dehydrogenase (short-subunit alcohol dehydrogenase family)/acyl carrier protein
VQALAAVYGEGRDLDLPLQLGTVKTNVGHLESAAGVAGVLKVLASLHHEGLPASLHASPKNPHMDWESLPVEVVSSLKPWPRSGRVRRAGVSAFGLSGTNAHVIIEEPQGGEEVAHDRGTPSPFMPLLLSARDERALQVQAGRWAQWLQQHPEQDWGAVLRNAALSRTHFDCRAAMRVSDHHEALVELRGLVEGTSSPRTSLNADPAAGGLAFLFTGQGSQCLKMGRDLYDTFPVFASVYDELGHYIDAHLERPLRSVMFAERGSEEAALLGQTAFTQPALFAFEVSLAALWRSWGVEPAVLLGHSIGELSAACVSGVLSREDAARLVCARGRLMQACRADGRMVSLQASEAEVLKALEEGGAGVDIAGLNGPNQTVISGDATAVLQVAERFEALGRKTTTLDVSHAFHSAHMEEMLEDFHEVATGCVFNPPQTAIVSNVTGEEASLEELTSPAYWVRQVRSAVRFVDGMQTLHGQGVSTFVECGPRGVLCGMAAACLAEQSPRFVVSHRKGRPEARTLLAALSEVHVAGYEVDWRPVLQAEAAERVDLPTYAFMRERFWLEESTRAASSAVSTTGRWALAGHAHALPGGGALHILEMGPGIQGYLGDHQVYGKVVVPGAFYVAVMLSVAATRWPDQAVEVSDVQFVEALWFDSERERVTMHVHLQPQGEERFGVTLAAYRKGEWVTHATGAVGASDEVPAQRREPSGAAEGDVLDTAGMLEVLEAYSIDWGPRWVWLQSVEESAEGRVGRLQVPLGVPVDAPIPGGLLDNSFSVPFLHEALREKDRVPRLPFGLKRLVWFGAAEEITEVSGDARAMGKDLQVSELSWWDARGGLVARLEGFTARRAPKDIFLRGSTLPLYQVAWQEADTVVQSLETSTVVLGGDGRLAALLGLEHVADLDGVLTLSTPPARVVMDATATLEGEVVEDVYRTTLQTLRRLQRWFSEVSMEETEAVWVTREAVRTEAVVEEALVAPVSGAYRLEILERGRLDRLGFVPEVVGVVSPGTVRIKTQAVGLNFRFIIDALGMFPGDAGLVGGDGVGVVTEVGAGVTHLAEGDRVLGLLDAVSESVVNASLLTRIPDALSFAEAATLPVAFITVAYGLADLGRLRRGERVLIHAGAGGVGMVAVQYARHLGAEVFATASRPKWDALRAMGLDDAHIASSRDADFLEHFRETTGGEGVDVVLNSLAGALTDAGLALLSEGGRFLEMGKTDLREPEAVAATHPGVEYTVFDIMPLILNEPERVATMLADAAQGYSEGWLQPLPVEVFPATRASVAFRWMAQARHIGKVVLSFGELSGTSVDEGGGLSSASIGGLLRTARQEHSQRRTRWVDVDSATPDVSVLNRALNAVEEPEVAVRGDEVLVPRLRRCSGDEQREALPVGEGTVLITGGTGDLGADLARHLVTNHGVAHLVLTSRRGLDAVGAPELVEELVALGAETVLVATCDVAQWDEVKQLDASLVDAPPLRDVFHLAGVIDDGLLNTLTPERVETVLAPKVKGAWNLHRWTRDRALTHFVVFSSFSGLTGNPGQGSYAAANVFMDALITHRREAGLPGLSLAWGPWSTGGMLATLSDAERTRMQRAGMVPLSAEEGFELMDRALARRESVLVSAHLDAAQVQRQVNEGAALPSLFKSLVSARRSASGTGGGGASALQKRLTALPAAEREASLLETLRAEVAQVLGLASGRSVNPTTSLQELGADSLMSVELRNRLVALTGATLPATLVFDYPTTEALTGFILTQLELKDAPQVTGRPRRPASQQLDEPIAVVSMACRFPGGVEDPEALWELLREGGDAITEVPKTRFDVNAVFDADPDAVGKTYTRWGGFVGDVDAFDAAFFGISPREAKSIDPQERLLLETTWELFERVGILPRSLVGSLTGVYLGISGNEYIQMAGMDPNSADAYSVLGTIHSAVSGRLSYWLGLEGPNMPVDTACSSSLVSLHLACQGLRQGECDMAIAGGVNLLLSSYGYVYFSRLKAMSPTGRCHAFSEDADGYVRAEGCGVLLLKRLSDAQADGDDVLAVVRGSAVNQDGQSNGFTAPNGPAQQAVIRRALAVADMEPASVDYVECHGTGTALGDPIEVQALGAVYGEDRPVDRPVVLGTVKSNIGHTESAAGVAGLMKVILSLKNEHIPKTLHVGTPNSRIPWDTLPVQIAVDSRDWTPGDAPRRAGVSSFGFSGTNAHVVLEEAPATRAVDMPSSDSEGFLVYPILLSGESEDALVGQSERLLEMLEGARKRRLEDLAFSLATTRTHFDHRVALSAGDVGSLKRTLHDMVDHREIPASVLRSPEELVEGKLVFLFTGQGSQRPGMGQALYGEYPVFKQALEAIAAAMEPHLEEPLLPVLFDADSERLHQTRWTQPALFALEVALYRLWESWGVVPDLLIGHSVGELAAAHVAGVMSLDDAARLVVARGRLMQELPDGGAMASLALDEDSTGGLLEDLGVGASVSIAGLNSPTQTVVSGDAEAVDRLVERCEVAGHRVKRLVVSHAFHSHRMEPMLEAFAEVAGSVTFAAPKISIVSNVTGALADDSIASAEYWGRHVREPVRFCDGIRVAMERGAETFVELGPSPVLSGLGGQCVEEGADPAWLPSLRARREEGATLQEAVSRVHVRGHAVNWAGFFAPVAPRVLPLPAYAFQRKRYWLEPQLATGGGLPGQYPGHNDLAGSFCVQPDGGWLHFIPVGPSHQPYLSDHIIHGQIIVAGAFHVGVLLAVAEEHFGAEGFVVEQIRFLRPLLADTDQVLQVALTSDDGGASYRARTLMLEEDDGVVAQWALFVEGVIIPGGAEPVKAHSLESARSLCTEAVDVAGYYADLAAVNIVWDPLWRWTLQAFAGPGGEGGFLELGPPEGLLSGNVPLHPVAIDNGFAALKLGMEVSDDEETPQLPFAVDRIAWHRQPRGRLWTYTRPLELGDDHSRFDLTFWDEDGQLVAEFFSCTIKRAPEALMLANAGASALDRWMFQVDWRAVERPAPAVEGTVALWARRDGALLEDVQGQLNDAGIEVTRLSEISDVSAESVSMVLAVWEGDHDVVSSVHGVSADALAQLQTLMAGKLSAPVVWITRDAAATGEADAVSGVGTSALWGLGRVARNESVDLALRLLDLDAGGEGLVEALSLKNEPECALREGELLAPRLMKNAAPAPSDAPLVNVEGTVLLTGGLGALGQEVARYLVNEHGVKHLLLTSRRGMGSPGAEALVEELRGAGAQVSVATCDVSERTSLDEALSSVQGEHPLCGVIHLAGLLDDGTIAELDSERLHRVLIPKVDGAWNLHQATRDLKLDLFVLFSSATGVIGGAGQANYAAANAFLDALAQHRRAQGLVGLSIAWGPWSSGGMAAALDDADKARMRRQGLGALEVAAGMSLLKRSLEQPHALSVVMALDPGRLQQSIERGGGDVPALYRGLIRIIPSSTTSASELRSRLEALPEEERLDEILAAIKDEIALVLGLSSGREVGANKSLQDLGIDSLMAVELSKRMVAMTNVKLPATLIFDYPTPGAIAGKLMTDLNLTSAGTPGATDKEPPPAPRGLTARDTEETIDVDALTDDQVEDALDAILGELG